MSIDFVLLSLTLSYEVAARINRGFDIFHSFFPLFSMFAIIVLFESFLPYRTTFENAFDRGYTYFKLVFIGLLNFVALSQGFLGGCVVYYPQTWFNRQFLGVDKPYEFGLFGRQMIESQYWWILQGAYILGALIALWRTAVFINKRVPDLRKTLQLERLFQR